MQHAKQTARPMTAGRRRAAGRRQPSAGRGAQPLLGLGQGGQGRPACVLRSGPRLTRPHMQVVAAEAVSSTAQEGSPADRPPATAGSPGTGGESVQGSVHAVDPDHHWAHFGPNLGLLQRAAACLQQGDLAQARELLSAEVAAELDRGTPACLNLRAECLAGLGQCRRREAGGSAGPDAEEEYQLFRGAIELRGNVAAYHAGAADALHKLGRLREAAAALQLALALTETGAGTAAPQGGEGVAGDLGSTPSESMTVVLFAEDVADPRRWRLQLELVQRRQAEEAAAAEADLLASLEAEAEAAEVEAARRQQRRKHKAQRKQRGRRPRRELEPEPEPGPEPRREREPEPEPEPLRELEPEPEPEPAELLAHSDGVPDASMNFVRVVSGASADDQDGVELVLAVPSASAPPLVTVTAEAAGADSPEQRHGVAGAALEVEAAEVEDAEADDDDAAGVGFGLKESPVSCHDIALVWVAFFSRWQRYSLLAGGVAVGRGGAPHARAGREGPGRGRDGARHRSVAGWFCLADARVAMCRQDAADAGAATLPKLPTAPRRTPTATNRP